jgi:hypothetical protein
MKTLSLYGDVKLHKVYCSQCKTNTFIIDGMKQCCLCPDEEDKPKRYKIECGGDRRRGCPEAIKKMLIEKQEDRCFYCG